jgi:hypothetical protein
VCTSFVTVVGVFVRFSCAASPSNTQQVQERQNRDWWPSVESKYSNQNAPKSRSMGAGSIIQKHSRVSI